jgi:multicomponent Na+:H+ antiporter subunit E
MSRVWFFVRHIPPFVWFLVVFVRELLVANATVAREVLTPGMRLEPAIIVVPTSCTTDVQMMLLANTITMTPGTLSLEVDTVTRELYVHGLFVRDRERFIADIHELERVLLRALT